MLLWPVCRGRDGQTRKIAAILAADVVGFSRMASADEDGTLALRTLRSELIDPTVVSQNGRIFKRTGDGALVEFCGVVEAVRCAITVQSAMIERHAGAPSERRIAFQIGVHFGDVVEESDGDLKGDRVNIAARLEGIARPGAICLSEGVGCNGERELRPNTARQSPTLLMSGTGRKSDWRCLKPPRPAKSSLRSTESTGCPAKTCRIRTLADEHTGAPESDVYADFLAAWLPKISP